MNSVRKNSTAQIEQDSVQRNVEFTIIDRKTAKSLKLNKFFTGQVCVNNHVSERYTIDNKCVECVKQRNLKRYDKEERRERHLKYYAENKDKVKDYQSKNRDRILKKKKEYRQKNRDTINESKRIWNAENRDHILKYKHENKESIKNSNSEYYKKNKDKFKVRARKYNKENPLSVFVRSTLKRIEKAKGVERIARTEIELGYTQDEFIKHITDNFKEGMSWENRSEWHIDHIKPISVLVKMGITDIKVINALSNLRPLWADENMRKYNKCQ